MIRHAAFVLCVSSVLLAAEKPVLDHLFPAGATRGTTNDLTLFGKFEPWPPKAWFSDAAIELSFTTNKGKAQVIVKDEARVGPSLIRLYNDEGASDLRIFVVSDQPELSETEPNNHFAKAQPVARLPVTLNGRLEKNGDVDSFSLQVKAGQWLDAALDSYTLFAKLDPVLRLVTTNGYQLAWNHDFIGLDPRVIWQAPEDGVVVLQVFGFVYPADSDIRLSGGAAGVYRLRLAVSDEPPADRRETPNEREPNNAAAEAPEISVASRIIGTICPPGDQDRFKIHVAKDQRIEARILAASRGSPLDAWLAVEDSEGKELVRNDDADNSRDPRLEWAAPEDGVYFLAVGSVTSQGALDCDYHLLVRELGPDFQLTSAADTFAVTGGATNVFKFAFKRLRGFTNELTASLKGLPDGVTAEAVVLPPKDGEVSLPVVAAGGAAALSGPFQVLITDRIASQERPARFDLISRTENNGVPGGYLRLLVESTDQFWLTVRPPTATQEKK